jgi:L-amino acid N-acyltransferase YncA
MKFVNATISDKEEILNLYRSLVGTEFCVWTQNYPTEYEFDGDLSRNALFCLKDDDEKIIGVISIDKDEAVEELPCWTKELQPSAELSRLGVREEYQN